MLKHLMIAATLMLATPAAAGQLSPERADMLVDQYGRMVSSFGAVMGHALACGDITGSYYDERRASVLRIAHEEFGPEVASFTEDLIEEYARKGAAVGCDPASKRILLQGLNKHTNGFTRMTE